MSKKKLAVIGVGSAGIQSLCHFLAYLDETWEVTSIHNPSKKILGIGESSNPTFISSLQVGLNFDIINDLEELNATLKFGTKYTSWRKESFTNPLIGGNVAIHFDTYSLYEFAFKRFKPIWGDKFNSIVGDVSEIENLSDKIKLKVAGEEHTFDYIIDCMGTPKSFEEYTVIDVPLLTGCLVHNCEIDPNSTPIEYTGHTATKDGWMFTVPLANRVSYGYLYNTSLTNEKDAKRNFSKLIDVPVDDLQDIKYGLKPYFSNKIIDGRIIKNGNAAVFIEPMFANSLWMYDAINQHAWDYLNGNSTEDDVNNFFINNSNVGLSMIAFHYLGGSSEYQTNFWEFAKKWSKSIFDNGEEFQTHINQLAVGVESGNWVSIPPWVFNSQGFLIISNNLGYDLNTITK